MEQVPIKERPIALSPQESLDISRQEMLELARESVKHLFTKRHLPLLNNFKGGVEFEDTGSFHPAGGSSLEADHIKIYNNGDEDLSIYIHELLHGYTNFHNHPERRRFKSGFMSQWEKGTDKPAYFLAINEALTELLTDEAFATVDTSTHLEIRKRLLERKKDALISDAEQKRFIIEKEIEGYLEQLSDLIRNNRKEYWDTEEMYREFVQRVDELNLFLEAGGSQTRADSLRETYREQTEKSFTEQQDCLLNLLSIYERKLQLTKEHLDAEVKVIDVELEGFLKTESYVWERRLVLTIVRKIAELTHRESEDVFEEMKVAYLKGNTLHLRIIGKVLGKDLLVVVASLGEEFEVTEADHKEALSICPDNLDVSFKQELLKSLSLQIAKDRFCKQLIEKIDSLHSIQD